MACIILDTIYPWHRNSSDCLHTSTALIAAGSPFVSGCRGLKPADRKIIREDIKEVEYPWLIGVPLVHALGRDLRKVRTSLTQSNAPVTSHYLRRSIQ